MVFSATALPNTFSRIQIDDLSPSEKLNALQQTTLTSSFERQISSFTELNNPRLQRTNWTLCIVDLANLFLRWTPLAIIIDAGLTLMSGLLINSSIMQRKDLSTKITIAEAFKDSKPNSKITKRSTELIKHYKQRKRDELYRIGLNAVIFTMGTIGGLGALTGLLSAPTGLLLLALTSISYYGINFIGSSIFNHRDTNILERKLIANLEQSTKAEPL